MDLERKTTHVKKVIQEVKTTHMQEQVLKSMSNIENLMSQKLQNTQQKLKVVSQSDKQDVLSFLKAKPVSRATNRSGSKGKNAMGKFKNFRTIKAPDFDAQ